MPVTSALVVLALISQADVTRRGIDEFRQGRYGEARADLEKAMATNSHDAPAHAFLAMTKAAMHDCADASAEFANNPDAALARMSGLAAVECEQSDEAFTLLAKLQKRFPADPDVLYEAAKLHRKAWDRAIEDLYRRAPSSYRVGQISAEVFEAQGKYGEAAAQYEQAIAKAPDALNLHYRLGRCLLLDSPSPEHLERARRQFEAELKLNPNDAIAEYQIGQILAAQQKPDAAVARYQEALTLRPDFVPAMIAAGKSRAQAKEYGQAVPLLEHAAALQPDNEAAHYNLMIVYRNLGRTADAQREKKQLDRLQKPPEGEFSEFLKKLDGKAPAQ
jgi:tetratricopeptide (TPR) repeat protein